MVMSVGLLGFQTLIGKHYPECIIEAPYEVSLGGVCWETIVCCPAKAEAHIEEGTIKVGTWPLMVPSRN